MDMNHLSMLPQNSIYVAFIDECCLHHDATHNGEEKLVSGNLFYEPKHK